MYVDTYNIMHTRLATQIDADITELIKSLVGSSTGFGWLTRDVLWTIVVSLHSIRVACAYSEDGPRARKLRNHTTNMS